MKLSHVNSSSSKIVYAALSVHQVSSKNRVYTIVLILDMRLHRVSNSNVYVIYLNAKNPDVENLTNPEFLEKMNRCLDVVEEGAGDKGIGLVIASQGKFFSNGHDVKWLSNTSISEGTRFINSFFETLERIMTLAFPTVAAMSGHAFAGGCLLAMACDYRVMREDRGFVCMNEVDMKTVKPGTYPDADRKVNAVLSSKLPVHILREMMLQGRRYGGKEAQLKKIVDLAVPEDRVLSASIDVAAKWASKASPTMGVLKTELLRGPSPVIIRTVPTSSSSSHKDELRMNQEYMARGYPPGPTRSVAKSLALRDMDTYVRLHKEYGDIFMLPLGQVPLVVTRSPEHIKSILGGEAMKLFPRPKHALESIRLLFGRAQIALDGSEHSANKRMLSRWLFSEEKNAEMSTHLSEVCQELVEKISEQAKPDVEVFRLAELASVDLNGVISLGKSYDALTRGRSPVHILLLFESVDFHCSLMLSHAQHTKQELEALKRADEIFLSRAMNKKWRDTETKETASIFEDAKQLLLKTFGDAEHAVRDGSRDTPSALRHMIEENASTRDKKCPMGRNPTPLELKSNLVGFLAGVGNSARLVAVVIEMFSRHKEMQTRFLVELHQVFGDVSPKEARERALRGEGVQIDRFDYDRLMRLEYLKCFIHECLRMYPPSVSVAPRSCSSDNPLGDYTIPSGTTVMCNIYGSHHHPNYWSRPDQFDPMRFSVSKDRAQHRPATPAFFPFGYGGHSCIGKNLAQIATMTIAAKLVASFHLIPKPGTRSPKFNTTNSKFLLLPHNRNNDFTYISQFSFFP